MRQISGGFLVQAPRPLRGDARRLARRHQGRADARAVARPRARVAHLRAREVERDRAREGRAGASASAPVSRTVSSRARSRRRRRRAGRAGGACASDAFYPFPDGIEAAAAAGVAAVIQPGGCDERRRDRSRRPTSSASRWCSPANGTSCIERDPHARGTGRARPRSPNLEPRDQGARRPRLHARARHDPRRRRRRERGLHPHEAGEGGRGRASRRRTCTFRRTRRRPTSSPRSATFNDDPAVDAMLVQHPTPPQIDYEAALLEIDPDKDVDGLHPVNLGRLALGVPGPVPCTPAGIEALLAHYEVPVVGPRGRDPRARLHARPPAVVAALAEARRPRTPRSPSCTPAYRIGRATRSGPRSSSPPRGCPASSNPSTSGPGPWSWGAAFATRAASSCPTSTSRCEEVAGWITPRVGGVGPTTIAMLFRNAVEAAERRAGIVESG